MENLFHVGTFPRLGTEDKIIHACEFHGKVTKADNRVTDLNKCKRNNKFK